MAKFHIPVNPFNEELRQIKSRQITRKKDKPKTITNDVIYQMLLDIIENQARLENMINKITPK